MESKDAKLRKILSSVVVTIFIIIGTVAVVFYARGFRFDRNMGVIDRTGVLNIESDPFRTDIFIDGEEIGKTPKTINALKEGFYEVLVTREGYTPWEKRIEVVAEKSTPIYPHLFLVDPELEDVFKLDNEIVDLIHPDRTEYIFIVTKRDIPQGQGADGITAEDDATIVPITEELPETLPPTEETGELSTYRIWRYDTNPGFWGASQNPTLIYEQDLTEVELFEFLPSPNGEYAVLTVTSYPISTDPLLPPSEATTGVLLIDTSLQNGTLHELDLEGFVPQYEMSWSKDNSFLMLESTDEIVSLEISNDRKYLLKKLDAELVWSTTADGNFYYTESDTDGNGNRYMRILETALTGSAPTVLVDRIYFRDSDEFLPSEEVLLTDTEPRIFTNSPANSQFAGSISQFWVEENVDQVVINTEFAMYIYNLTTDKYTLVHTDPGTYYGISPDSEKFLFLDNSDLHVFQFDKEEADHTSILGNRIVAEDILIDTTDEKETEIRPDTITNSPNDLEMQLPEENEPQIKPLSISSTIIQWHNNSRLVFYAKGGTVYSIEIDGQNMNSIVKTAQNFFVKDSSGDRLFILDTLSAPQKIVRATVN